MLSIENDPDHFYLERVPRHWNQSLDKQRKEAAQGDETVARLLGGMERVQATIDICLERTETVKGSDYHLNIRSGVMQAEQEPYKPPFLTLAHDQATFATLESESGDSILGFLGALTGQEDELRLTDWRIQKLRGISGSLRFEVTGGRPFLLTAHLGEFSSSAEPKCNISLDRKTYGDLKSGSLSVQDAFLGGHVSIEGEIQMAMEIAFAALAPH